MEPPSTPLAPPRTLRPLRRWFWLDAIAILTFSACSFGAFYTRGSDFVGVTYLGGLWLLWGALVGTILLVYFVRAVRNRGRRSRGRTPLVNDWRLAVFVALAGLVPIAASAGLWTSQWKATRALQAAFEHCEQLFDEMEQYRALHRSYPSTLAELPSTKDEPAFTGSIDYAGGGPTKLSIEDDRSLFVLVWSFDSTTGEWKSWDPF